MEPDPGAPGASWLPQAEMVLARRFGLEFGALRREMHGRLVRAFKSSGHSDPRAFTAALASLPADDALSASVLAELTIGETSFFRSAKQLELLERVVFPAIADLEPSRPLRVWSAGCATGEETYTLAMLLDRAPELAAREREVVGTDVVAARLEAARAAVYPARALATTPPDLRLSHFAADGPGRLRLRAERLRTSVRFEQHNLVREVPPRSLDRLALIVCRNVLIYYADLAARRAILDSFHERLSPGGWVLFGHAEVPMDADPRFEAVQADGALVYRKRARPRPGPPIEPRPPATASARTAPVSAARPAACPAPPVEEDLAHARGLALAAVERAPRDAVARALLVSLLERAGELEEARRVALAGVYLAPESAVLRGLAAALLERQGLPLEAAELRAR